MKRLTELYTYRNGEDYICSEAIAINDDIRSCLEKLYELENIEEELDISLLALLKQGKITITEKYNSKTYHIDFTLYY